MQVDSVIYHFISVFCFVVTFSVLNCLAMCITFASVLVFLFNWCLVCNVNISVM